ncbi:MAG: diacylglycerol/lipid kinase family protein [Thermoplasmatota archaeon]
MADGAVPLVYNPASGGGRGRVRFRKAEATLAIAGFDLDPIETTHAGHAIDLGRELADAGHERILGFGGDGTLSELANGVLASGKQPTLGFIPSGTGNDFLRHFGVLDVDEAIRRIRAGRTMDLDVVRMRHGDGETWSINLCGCGFGPRSVIAANKRYKWAGPQAYNLGVVDQIVRLGPTPTRLTMDGETLEGDFPLILACTTTYTGGAMKMAPDADPQDGLVDVMWVDPIGRLELLKLLGGIRKATHVGHPKVHFRQAAKVRIETDVEGPLLGDGEVYGSTPVDLDVVPGALRVLL